MKLDLSLLPSEVQKLFTVFAQQPDAIRLVGGSVRDLLLGKKVSDFDFATKFLPDEIEKILEKNHIKAIPTGKKFGTITAVLGGKNFEITTLRKDNETNGRHCQPHFVDDYQLDASRRDFTINALYLDAQGVVHDYFGGFDDLKAQKVRFIGDAKTRIEEDYLRILRFFRFSCNYAANLDLEGLQASALQKHNLKKLSRERVRSEILKILESAKKENLLVILKEMHSTKIAAELFSSNLDYEALKQLFLHEEKFSFSANSRVKMAVLFLSAATDFENFFKEICATNLEKKFFNFVKNYSNLSLGVSELRRLLAFYDQRDVLDLYLVLLAKKMPQNVENDLHFLRNFILPEFPLIGQDFINAGLDGSAIGAAIEEIKNIWADQNFSVDRTALLKFIKR